MHNLKDENKIKILQNNKRLNFIKVKTKNQGFTLLKNALMK